MITLASGHESMKGPATATLHRPVARETRRMHPARPPQRTCLGHAAERPHRRAWTRGSNVHRVASNMAILEASQTVASAIAAGREDLIVQARSLGRHERPRPLRGAAQAFLLDRRSPPVAARQVGGMEFNDHADEFGWIRSRLISAGLRHLIAVNLTVEGMYPASAVRVVIPGLETTNPFHIGRRGRFALIEDLA